MSYQPGQPQARRKSKAPRRILISLLVLVVLLVAADRVGDLVAEKYASDKLRGPLGVQNLDVDIDGFPFLTQFASGDYERIELSTKDYQLGGSGLRFDTVEATLDDVTETGNFRTFHAEQANAVGTVSYSSLSQAIGVNITYAGDGKIRASKEISILGYTINPTVTVRPEVSGGTLRFLGDAANGLGALGGELSQAVDAVFGTGVPLQGLPFDIRVTKLQSDEQGLRLDLAGSDLTYSR